MKAHIVGGGFGGLAAAACLIRNTGIPGQDVTIYEADDRLVQEVRRIAVRLAQRRIEPALIVAWSLWRRAHQAAAQQSHPKRKMQL
jgi:2-polyprenyl-6-methoxyphenol hydroxylase-like FAD-dependent oxidoreductase